MASQYQEEWMRIVTGPRQVLLVDDSVDDCLQIQRASKEYNIEWTVAHTVEDALRLIHNCKRYRLAVVDLHIGTGRDAGVQIYREIKEKCPWLPVLILSGYINEEVFTKITDLGFAVFLKKPPAFDRNFFGQLFLTLNIPRRETSEMETKIGENI